MIDKNQEMRNINVEDYLLYIRMHIQIKKLCNKDETSIRKQSKQRRQFTKIYTKKIDYNFLQEVDG